MDGHAGVRASGVSINLILSLAEKCGISSTASFPNDQWQRGLFHLVQPEEELR